MIRVLAIDPGTTHTGVALVDERGVSCAQTLRFPDMRTVDNAAIFDRAQAIAERLEPILTAWRHDVVVLEGYQYFGSISSAYSATQTPILVGYLARFLKGENLQPQHSPELFNKNRAGNVWRRYGVNPDGTTEQRLRELMRKIPGGDKAKDEHQRAAVAHAVFYISKAER